MDKVLLHQRESAFQKQEPIFYGKHRTSSIQAKSLKRGKKLRYYKNIGLGFKTPKAAIEGDYVDKKCPFTGPVSIRGRILRGRVISTKMQRTIVVRRDYLHYYRKYNRFEKRHKNISVHCSPAFVGIKEGDIVTIGQCRPLSKTVRFNVLKVEPAETTGLQKKKQFVIF